MRLTAFRFLAIAAAFAVSGIGAPVAREITTAGRVRLTQIVGKVTFLTAGKGVPARETEFLAPGGLITAAGGAALLMLSNGATVAVHENTDIVVLELRQDSFSGDYAAANATLEPNVSQAHLHLSRGEVVITAPRLRLADGSSFTLQTPAGPVTVKSSERLVMRVAARPQPSGEIVFEAAAMEGEIEVDFAAAAKARELAPGRWLLAKPAP